MPSGINTTIGIAGPPAQPVLSSVASGTLAAATYYVVITYENNIGETLASTENSIAIAANNVFKVASPSAATNAVNYRVYASTTAGSEQLQATVAIGTAWQEPNAGLIAGSSPPTSIPLVDLDSILLGFVSGHTQAAATGIEVAGVDLNQRYEKLSYGTASSKTNIQSAGADLNTFFCANASGAGSWTASLPSFPNVFTTSPQPSSGTVPMMVTINNSPGGTLTYTWSWSASDGGSFNIVSGQGTNTIQWYATGGWTTITVTCKVTSSASSTSVSANTSLRFQVGTPH